jgi:hypothetical protein
MSDFVNPDAIRSKLYDRLRELGTPLAAAAPIVERGITALMAFSPIERLILLFEADPLESFRRNGRTVVQVDTQQLDLGPAVTSVYFRELTVPDETALRHEYLLAHPDDATHAVARLLYVGITRASTPGARAGSDLAGAGETRSRLLNWVRCAQRMFGVDAVRFRVVWLPVDCPAEVEWVVTLLRPHMLNAQLGGDTHTVHFGDADNLAQLEAVLAAVRVELHNTEPPPAPTSYDRRKTKQALAVAYLERGVYIQPDHCKILITQAADCVNNSVVDVGCDVPISSERHLVPYWDPASPGRGPALHAELRHWLADQLRCDALAPGHRPFVDLYDTVAAQQDPDAAVAWLTRRLGIVGGQVLLVQSAQVAAALVQGRPATTVRCGSQLAGRLVPVLIEDRRALMISTPHYGLGKHRAAHLPVALMLQACCELMAVLASAAVGRTGDLGAAVACAEQLALRTGLTPLLLRARTQYQALAQSERPSARVRAAPATREAMSEVRREYHRTTEKLAGPPGSLIRRQQVERLSTEAMAAVSKLEAAGLPDLAGEAALGGVAGGGWARGHKRYNALMKAKTGAGVAAVLAGAARVGPPSWVGNRTAEEQFGGSKRPAIG